MAEHSPADTFKVLIATDVHLGYLEKDPIRGNDSFAAFEELLKLARNHDVDMVLLGGDLFHENKPSRSCLHQCMKLLRQYTMGDRPCQFQILSDQSVNFGSSAAGVFARANYQDPNYNVGIPVFSIHGNHDDPAGDGQLAALDLLQVSNLVNYFGKAPNTDDITVAPILFQKGISKFALYGLGNVRDERLHRTFTQQQIKMLRPAEDKDDWFNVFVLHQNRAKHGTHNYIPESFIPSFFDLVVWGHEHACEIDPVVSTAAGEVYITQPGSSVATSLSEGEALKKHVGVLSICNRNFHVAKYPLTSVRPFKMDEIELASIPRLADKPESIEQCLVDKVEEMIAEVKASCHDPARAAISPLIRLRVEHTGFTALNVQRFGQQFVRRVANPKDILLFFRRPKKVDPREHKKQSESEKPRDVVQRHRPAALDTVSMDELIEMELASMNSMKLLEAPKLNRAVKNFVDKGTNEAITAFVKWQVENAQDVLQKRKEPLSTSDDIEKQIKDNRALISLDAEAMDDMLEKSRKDTAAAAGSDEDPAFRDGSASPPPAGSGKASRGRGAARGAAAAAATTGRGRGRGASKAAAAAPAAPITALLMRGGGRKTAAPKAARADVSDDGEQDDAPPSPPPAKKRAAARAPVVINDDDDEDEEEEAEVVKAVPAKARAAKRPASAANLDDSDGGETFQPFSSKRGSKARRV